jgi:HAD superfamily hydrolase (TIGR01549 family)
MPVRAVLFDLGNTLWHIPEPPPIDQIRRETVGRILTLLRSWGIEAQDEHRFLGRDIRLAITAADKQAYESDCVSPNFAAIVQGVAAKHGLELTSEQAERLWHTWNLPGDFFGRRPFEDAIDTLETLRARGLRLACVTNRVFSGPAFFEEVDALGLTPHFDVLVASCDIGYMKPHQKIFLHALDLLAVAPRDAVMVGDSLRADVAGAQALGMTAVWRKPRKPFEEPDGIQPHFTIEELRELLDLPIFA